MSDPRAIDETLLHAYADDDLDPETRAEVEAWLAAHPEDRRRVEAWQMQKALLHGAFDKVLDEPVPTRLLQAARGGRKTFPWRQLAAACVLLAVGAGAGWFAHDRFAPHGRTSGIAQRAIGAYVLYAAEVRHPVEVTSAEEAHLIQWLSRRLGEPLKLPDLRSKGFKCMGGRLLPDEGRPAAQFMYEDESGGRLTLYLRATPGARETAFRFMEDRDVSAFYWVDGKFSYALTARLPRDRLLQIANVVYDSLPK